VTRPRDRSRGWYLIALAVAAGCARRPGGAVEASHAVYLRADTDATVVVSPRTSVAGEVGDDLRVEAAHTVDVWTGASVDVVAAATRAIEEQRHEVQAGGSYRRGAASVAGSYRHSTEPDYESHGGVLRGTLELDRKNTVLGLALTGAGDTVGRAGDPWFQRPQWSLGARATWTQVLGRRAIGEVAWESGTIQGFQSSPYRWVAVGGQGVCAGGAPYCVPENVPDERFRHSATAQARVSGPSGLSFGARYRFYFDSWGLTAHTVEPDVAFTIGRGGTLSLRFRHHAQGEASFYQPRYFRLDAAGFVTRDRKLSAMTTQTLGIGYLHDVMLSGSTLSFGLQASGTYFTYLAFVGLEHVRALELTALFGGRFDVAGASSFVAPSPSP
jgi:hypothetical protein